jgi:hypothetical protein
VQAAEGVRAFPGAQGFAARITGGRGGRIIKVTTLAASGPGSLQEALNVNAPRIIVFDVSGVIEADRITVNYGNVTVAGQTAPGAGITIRGQLFGKYSSSVGNIIIRHLRVRPVYNGATIDQFDAVQFSLNHHVMLDHLSISGGVDETVDIYEARDITLSWSVIENSSTQGESAHNFGLINGPNGMRVSVINSLFAHHDTRCPAIANGPAELAGNVIYNCRIGFIHHNPATGPFNLVSNTFRAGSSNRMKPYHFDDENGSAAANLAYFLSGNILQNSSDCSTADIDNPWSTCNYSLGRSSAQRATLRHNFSGTGDTWLEASVGTAADAYTAVMERAGAFPRDVQTRRSIEETQSRTGAWGARIPANLLEGLTPGLAPQDSDSDGMPDSWELDHGLNPQDGTDHGILMASGYTAIEEYINGLADSMSPNPVIDVIRPNPPTNIIVQ